MNRKPMTLLRRAAATAAIVALATGLLIAGAHWHEPIAHWFRGHGHPKGLSPIGTKKQLWTCGMHPQVIRDQPGLCPICHMKLTPLAADDGGEVAAVTIDPVVVQNMGVRVAEVQRGPLVRAVRGVGYLDQAEPNIHDVNLRVSGWIERLYADTAGMHLAKGDRLFDLYSPELQVAVEELIAGRRVGAGSGDGSPQTSAVLVQSTRRKLERWGLAAEQIDHLAALDHAPRTITFTSPLTGHVTEKAVVDGAAVKAGDRVLQIVDHSTLWLDVQVYAQDLPAIRLDQTVTATVEGLPSRRFEGAVIFVHPHVDPTTRTATVRMTIPNAELTLRPGMYATAHITVPVVDDAVLMPREAVIDTGTRQIAFVAAGGGRFEPRELTVGAASADGMVQILGGVAAGERVVTSGQFLLDAESHMREAIQKYLKDRLLMEQQ